MLTTMTPTRIEPSLLHFLQGRLDEDVDVIIANTPIVGVHELDTEFERRFLSRGALLERLRTDQATISLLVQAMQSEQGSLPNAPESFAGGPVTDIGSDLLKLLAARYADHEDYRTAWRPGIELPRF